MTLGRFEPGIGNTKAFDPVAKIQCHTLLQYLLEVVTILFYQLFPLDHYL